MFGFALANVYRGKTGLIASNDDESVAFYARHGSLPTHNSLEEPEMDALCG